MKIYQIVLKEKTIRIISNKDSENILDDPFYGHYYEGTKKHLPRPETFQFENSQNRTINRTQRQICDITQSETTFMFNQKAMNTLSLCWNDNCEFFEMKFGDYVYYLINLLYPLENTIDYEYSDIIWVNEQEKRASWLNKITFIPENIGENIHVFKPKEFREIFVTEHFVQTCIDGGLSGAEFILMYDSEDDSHVFPFKTIISL